MRTTLIAGIFLPFAFPASGSNDQSERWESLWEKQAAETATWSGASYEQRLIASHNRFWRGLYAKCAGVARRAGIEAFKAVAVIDAKGNVSEFVVFSKDKALNCFVEEMVGKQYPVPPVAPFHEGFEITLAQP
ncbi:hypothetical protein MMG85_05820 [Pseudoxanthomonas sp. LH2527]|uniref:hypothetical protein n=1 Tax=Pseudoxanthomonas sp. LH2527 TaxID=2923249 RepID=UPI001F148871|nr:hypothetical protein [Pseudoxanthomonas sp. LH2527]MCH6483079.1 hypothetical protein [Pseudoxanthomonas sp. LH2527]